MNKVIQILYLAKSHLEESTPFKLTWTDDPDNPVVTISLQHKTYSFLPKTRERLLPPFPPTPHEELPPMIIGSTLSGTLKKNLREHQIAYLEANGNLFFQDRTGALVWIEAHKPILLKRPTGDRAFSKTGLKALFYLLLFPEHIQLPYRQLARQTGISLGNLTYILANLEENGFLLKKNNTTRIWNKNKSLLEKWSRSYADRLKPGLFLGAFRFLQPADWKNIALLPGKSWWGAEPAAELLINSLQPQEWTLYTREQPSDLIKNYHLVPDPNGPILVFRSFWEFDLPQPTVPPLLVYADLIHTENARCLETAGIIFQKFLDDNL